ncbi:hypothetical protein N7G274_004334 [Stereocaulon virgatum]|uniref:C2H2-type domain-containing protein n=1 Tax=Stereocaulon virgatum TaxID=373712 RepID=A0ABR4A9X0_9LECA
MEGTSNFSYSPSLHDRPLSSSRPWGAPTSPLQPVSLPVSGRRRERGTDPLITSAPKRTHAVPPTPPQQYALKVLERFYPSEVLAWLRILRCLEPGYQHNGVSGELSAPELDAASVLKSCTDDQVLPWLEHANNASVARGSQIPPTSTPSLFTKPSLNQRVSRHESQSFCFGDASSIISSSIYNRRTSQSTLPSSLSNGTTRSRNLILEEASTASSKTSDHDHWCTICEHSKVYKTCDGWKRHMREHEIIYPCMPNGPVRETETGPRCCFCDLTCPDHEHLDTHSISRCYGGCKDAQKYSRRVNLIKHIEDIHHTSNAIASALADEWQNSHKRKRKFFSCGFCVTIFSTLRDQNSHIDKEHWSQHQDRRAWDTTKVILGLLRQPGVRESWQELLTKSDIRSDSELWPRWDPTTSEALQLNLEIRQGSAQALAQLAFKTSSYYQSRQVVPTPEIASQRCSKDFEIERNTSASQNADISMQVPRSRSAFQRDSSSEFNHFPIDQSGVDVCHDTAGKLELDSLSTQYNSLQPINASSEIFSANTIDEGTVCYSGNPTDRLELRPSDIGNVSDPWNRQDEPWTPFATTERQTNEGGATCQALFGEVTPGNYGSTYSPTPLGISSRTDAYQSEAQVQSDDLLRNHPMYIPLASTNNVLPTMTVHTPVRKRSPRLVVRSKRKLSGSKSRDYQSEQQTERDFMIDTGNDSQYRYSDDHVRSRRRIESAYHT